MTEVLKTKCPVAYCMSKIGNKWKPIILYLIKNNFNRFGKMQKLAEGISRQALTKQLRELEKDGIIERVVYPEIPPRVEYYITPYGESLYTIINQMESWGEENLKQAVNA